MSIYWIVGSIYYFSLKESPFNKRDIVNNNEQIEGITFLLACYNESETVRDTLSNVLSLNYAKGNYYHQ